MKDMQLAANSYFSNALGVYVQLSPEQIVHKPDVLDQRDLGGGTLKELGNLIAYGVYFFCSNLKGQIVSSLNSDGLAYPELPVADRDATARALDRSHSEVSYLHASDNFESIIFLALLADMQFHRTGDLDESIQALVEYCNAANPDCHHATVQAFLKRFGLTRNIEDHSISGYLDEAFKLRSPVHSLRNHSLSCLCRALTVFVHRQAVGNTHAQAIDQHLKWIAVLAFAARVISERGVALSALVQRIVDCMPQAINGVDRAFQYFEEAAKHGTGTLRERLSAAIEWAAKARGFQHNTTEDAYETAMDLLDRCQITYTTVDSKHEFLTRHLPVTAKEASSLASDAASLAIENGHSKKAVEIVERGKTFVWATMCGYRPDLVALCNVGPDLADKFQFLSTKLERFAALSELPSSHPTLATQIVLRNSWQNDQGARRPSTPPQPLDDRAVRVGSVIGDEWDAIVKGTRNLVGFREFLKPQSFGGPGGLRQAAAKGPVVMLNLSNDYGADALVLLPSAQIIPVRLGNPADIVELIHDYENLGSRVYLTTQQRGSRVPGKTHERQNSTESESSARPRGIYVAENDTPRTFSTLSRIVERCSGLIMDHVKAALLDAQVAPKSRIWLCPMGPIGILPLHAAGVPVFDRLSQPDLYFIPSYTPSLSALIAARRHATELYLDPKLLIVGAPGGVSGLPHLPDVSQECTIARELVPNGLNLVGSSASRHNLLNYLPDHSWVHFACHGLHNDDAPFESAFMLSDGPFTLRELITTHPRAAGLAFLSACQTAAFSSSAPNEVLHLSAGMQFCGFASVVGTQWPVLDGIALELTEAFYKELLRGNKANLTDSAEALHTSLMLLKTRGRPVENLVPFIHLGI
jgi:hypothetical protein